jgi:hypothetical protein
MELSALTIVVLLIAGVLIGNISAMVGIGGGLLIVPLLVYVYGFKQVPASATSLAVLLPPVGIFAVIEYHRAGQIQWPFVVWLALGFVVGALVGARLMTSGVIPVNAIRIVFSALLIYTAARMLFQVFPSTYATTMCLATVAVVFVAFWLLRLARGKFAESTRLGGLYRSYLKTPNAKQGDYAI